MIRLTEEDGKSVYVPADVLIRDKVPFADSILGGKETKTHVIWGNYEIVVTESSQEVARKVLEWKLEKDWHHASIIAEHTSDVVSAKRKLIELSGLEEPNHD